MDILYYQLMDKKRTFAYIDAKTAKIIAQRAKELEALTGRYNYSQAIAVIVREWQDAGCSIPAVKVVA